MINSRLTLVVQVNPGTNSDLQRLQKVLLIVGLLLRLRLIIVTRAKAKMKKKILTVIQLLFD